MSWRIVLIACLAPSLVSCESSSTEDERTENDTSYPPALARASSPSEALRLLPVSLGDKVRIVSSPVTDEFGIAGLTGRVSGVTSQQTSGNEVVEGAQTATAVTVFIEELDQQYGLSANLVELTDLPPGTTVFMGDREWINTEGDEWKEVDSDR